MIDPEIGSIVSTHRRASVRELLAGAFTCAGAIAIWIAIPVMRAPEPGKAALVGALLAVGGSFLIWVWFHERGMVLDVGETGLRLQRAGVSQVCRWESVQSVQIYKVRGRVVAWIVQPVGAPAIKVGSVLSGFESACREIGRRSRHGAA